MGVFKKATVVLLIAAVCFIVGGLSLRVFSQEQEKEDFGKITFAVMDGLFCFFDSASATIYSYSTTTGRLVATYKVQALGQNLEKTEERRAVVY